MMGAVHEAYCTQNNVRKESTVASLDATTPVNSMSQVRTILCVYCLHVEGSLHVRL